MNKPNICILVSLCLFLPMLRASTFETSSAQQNLPLKSRKKHLTNKNYTAQEKVALARKSIISRHHELVKKGDFRALEVMVIHAATQVLQVKFHKDLFITSPDGRYRDSGITQEEDIQKYYISLLTDAQKQDRFDYEKQCNKRIKKLKKAEYKGHDHTSYEDILEYIKEN